MTFTKGLVCFSTLLSSDTHFCHKISAQFGEEKKTIVMAIIYQYLKWSTQIRKVIIWKIRTVHRSRLFWLSSYKVWKMLFTATTSNSCCYRIQIPPTSETILPRTSRSSVQHKTTNTEWLTLLLLILKSRVRISALIPTSTVIVDIHSFSWNSKL